MLRSVFTRNREFFLRDLKRVITINGEGRGGVSMEERACFSATSAASAAGRLEGKVALITGGASGIGKATAQEFIKQGAAQVILADIDPNQGPKTAKELGPKAHFIQCDVATETQLAEAVDFAMTSHGKLDIMYNNAGIAGPMYPPSVSDLNLEDFDRVMSVNVRGTMAGIKHAARVMIPAKSGSILCTASISGIMGGNGPHPYSISKFTIPGIVKSVASEMCKHGIRINCISPFVIWTPIVRDQLAKIYAQMGEEWLKNMVHGLGELDGEICEEIDIANAAVYLASDEAKYVTGHNLVVDGGYTSFKELGIPRPGA